MLPATILGSSMGFIDGSVVNVALPAIRAGLGAQLATMQWVVNGYLLALASLTLLGGSAGDRFGRRRVFVIGLLGFTSASVACGLAPSAFWLIVARAVQGIGAALLTPASLAIVGAAYGGAARGPAIGTWAAAGALTTALGPPLGGWLVDALGWRSIFFVNLPVGIAALVLALQLPRDGGSPASPPLDKRGSALAVLSLAALSYGLIALGGGVALRGAIAIAAAVPFAALFVRAEARARAPMMPLALFQSREFSGANVLTVLLYAALGGALFLLPFLLIEAHGYSAFAAGAAFLPFPVIMGLGSRWSGGLVDKVGARLPLIAGSAVAALGYAALGLADRHAYYWTAVLPGLVGVGIGMTLCVSPLTTAVLNAAPRDRSGTASGINNAAARAGSLIAVAALGLAVGGRASNLDAAALTEAYRLTMWAAATLATLSAVTAALTITPGVRPRAVVDC